MRTDEENLARRAWASAYWRDPVRQLPLLVKVLPHTRPVYHRIARKALQSNDPRELADALATVQTELARVQAARALVRQHMPLVYDYLHPAA